MHTSFARTLQRLTCAYLGFATLSTCTHMQAQKHTHAHTRARESLSPALLSVWKVRFMSEIHPALLCAQNSTMLVFHEIIKAHLALTRLKLYFVGFQNVTKVRFTGFQISHYHSYQVVVRNLKPRELDFTSLHGFP